MFRKKSNLRKESINMSRLVSELLYKSITISITISSSTAKNFRSSFKVR